MICCLLYCCDLFTFSCLCCLVSHLITIPLTNQVKQKALFRLCAVTGFTSGVPERYKHYIKLDQYTTMHILFVVWLFHSCKGSKKQSHPILPSTVTAKSSKVNPVRQILQNIKIRKHLVTFRELEQSASHIYGATVVYTAV